jgi:hypothetical protein
VNVDVLVPALGSVDIAEVERRVSVPRRRPFATELLDVSAAIADKIFADAEAKRYPELQALAFWMRKAAVHQLKTEFDALDSSDVMLAPRGVVFHIPPANVDTMFVYSWLLAFLAGNHNIVRISSRQTPQVRILIRVLDAALGKSEAGGGTVMVTYGHDAAITERLTGLCDVRVIWGGDATVSAVRAVPLPPHAKELTFSDRFSFSAIRTESYLDLSDKARAKIAEKFFNDTYWFDQLGCSSARLLVWCGSEGAEEASERFRDALRAEIDRRSFSIDASTALHKMTFAFRASIDRPVTALARAGNELMTMSLATLEGFDRHHSGAGMFFERVVDGGLEQLSPFVARRDQTMTHLGFSQKELRAFAEQVNGRGVDRMVPIGEALDFARYWDGYDLLQEYTRRVVMKT